MTTSTFDIMKSNQTIGGAEALRRAMLAYLNDGTDIWNAYPGFWGSFSLVGEGTMPDAVDPPPLGGSRPSASAPRRAAAVASAEPATIASATPWPLADRTGSKPIPNALAYAAQPTPIANARAVPMAFEAPRAAPLSR